MKSSTLYNMSIPGKKVGADPVLADITSGAFRSLKGTVAKEVVDKKEVIEEVKTPEPEVVEEVKAEEVVVEAPKEEKKESPKKPRKPRVKKESK